MRSTTRASWLCLALLLTAGCRARAQTAAPTAAVSDTARASFEAGVAAMGAGSARYDDALRAFSAALSQQPDLWEAHLDIGIIELRRARLSAAAKSLERSVAIHPSFEGLDALGEVYVRQGRPAKAVELYTQALQRAPGELALRNRLAVALRRADRRDEAEAEIRAILARDADNVEAYCTLAAIHLDGNQVDLAELVLTKGLSRHPDDPRLLTNLGLLQLRRGNDQEAFALFEKASVADPAFTTGRLNKAAVYLRAGDHARAQEELDKVLAIEPGNTAALLALGITRRMSGDTSGARKAWERLLEIDPEYAAAHFNLGILAMDFTDSPQLAQTHLKRYLDLVPKDDPHAQAARERLELLDAMKGG
jgi:tetratricopeptide (TPR) repeat protein